MFRFSSGPDKKDKKDITDKNVICVKDDISKVMVGISYEFTAGGELVEVKIPRGFLVFTRDEWVRGIRRGKSVLRARRAHDREEARIAKAVDAKMSFPRFS
jgi:hypothetical protein